MVVMMLLLALLTGLCLLSVGPLLMQGRQEAMLFLLILVTQMAPLRAVAGFITVLKKKRQVSLTAVLLLLFETAIMALLVVLPVLSREAFLIFLLLYLSFIVTIKGIDTFLYARARSWPFFVASVVATVMGAELFRVILFNVQNGREKAVFLAIGVLLMIFGTGQICDFMALLIKNRKVNKVLRNIRLALPDLTGLLIPLRTAELLPEAPLRGERGTVEVIFQVSPHGISVAGHCELCVDGWTYTYGAYDPAHQHIFKTVGRGILVKAPRDEYLAYCMEHFHKKVIRYRLSLDPEQETLLRGEIAKLDRCLEPWMPQLSPKAYASRLQQIPGVHFYRIVRGRFRRYFIPTINCVSLTDSLLGETELGHAHIMGIKTPGAYMDHLERSYLAETGLVKDRHVLTLPQEEPTSSEE